MKSWVAMAVLCCAVLNSPAYAATSKVDSSKVKTSAKASKKDHKRRSIAQAPVPSQAKFGLELIAVANDVQPASPAFISLLKDITKSLSESSDYTTMNDPRQKAAVSMALSVLKASLNSSQLNANRIISNSEKESLDQTMSAESWDSGEVIINDTCRASASCIWARKSNGLINITIAGICPEFEGQKLGEFVFVASGRSAVESGFDIQSQSSVNYWLGKLTNFVADTASSPSIQTTADTTAPTAPTGTADSEPKTEKAESSEPTKSAEPVSSPQAEIPNQPTPTATAAKPTATIEDQKPPRRSYLLLKAPSIKRKPEVKSEVKEAAKPEVTAEKPATPATQKPEPQNQVEPSKAEVAELPKQTTITEQPPEQSQPISANQETASQTPTIQETSTASLDTSVKPVIAEPVPSADAAIVNPEKAQAGQSVTVSVVNSRLYPEPGVDVDFNGAVVTTGANGQAQYLVPDDSTPGPTLKVSIAGRIPQSTKVIQILQPLSTPAEPQVPRIDRVSANVSKFDTVAIQGHNFNGQAEHNTVTIDGKWTAQVLATSPLELKIIVPEDVPAGQHTIAVSNSGLKSNPAPFSLISLQVAPDARPGQAPTKLIVRALGTAKPVAVHLKNNTPNIITIVKGNDLRLKTPGGKDNSIAVSVRLKQRGNYIIQANIE